MKSWNDLLTSLRELAATSGPPALVMFDWDRAVVFNDEYGTEMGDRVLEKIGATILIRAAEQGLRGGRINSDTFAVVFPRAQAAHARQWAEETVQAVHDLRIPFSHSELGDLGFVSVTGGACSAATTSVEQLVLCCEESIFAGKRAGRNRVVGD
jgi:diguanylate cyclase (GGDEF)-like protein